jgi:ectoine hydroxylase-related dioxygenase (phytanoyl-CoA dioxygenase family)
MLDQDKTMRQLSSLREQYEREGYVVVRNVIDADLVDEGRAHIA